MSPSVLGHLTMGYQLVWNRLRQIAAVQLFIDSPGEAPVDAEHLLRTLIQAWSLQSPQLILSVQSPQLLADLLLHANSTSPWIAVPGAWMADSQIAHRVHGARHRQVSMLWRGEHAERESLDTAADFLRGMVCLNPGEVLQGARAALHPDRASQPADSPVLPDQIYEGVPNRVLAAHCLDQRDAWGVAGWPVEDVLQAYQNRVPPDLRTVVRLQAAAEADASLEVIEGLLGDDPVLAYRFLRYANSAVFNLRDGVEALRQGIMVLGMSRFRQWLGEQLAGATEDPQLLPVRRAMVVRARLVEHLLDAGDEVRLRHEVSLCARLAQIDLLVGEPLLQAVQHIPLSERVLEGIISHRGPYAPYLELAAALEYPQMPTVPGLCDTHGVDIADVNRELLRVLSQSHLDPAWGR